MDKGKVARFLLAHSVD